MNYVVVIAALLMVLTTGQDLSLAQKRDSDARESLKGLPGVTVLIEGIKEDAQADGLSTEAVRTAVELTLRSSGIRILTASEGIATPPAPLLYVNIGTVKSPEGHYAYDVTVQLSQHVALLRRQTIIRGITWQSAGVVGMTPRSQIQKVITTVEREVKVFANDFLTVNPQ